MREGLWVEANPGDRVRITRRGGRVEEVVYCGGFACVTKDPEREGEMLFAWRFEVEAV